LLMGFLLLRLGVGLGVVQPDGLGEALARSAVDLECPIDDADESAAVLEAPSDRAERADGGGSRLLLPATFVMRRRRCSCGKGGLL